MNSQVPPHGGGVLSRVLLLYGAYTLFHNVAFLFGYYLLSPGFMKKHPAAMIASRVAEASGFWWELPARSLSTSSSWDRYACSSTCSESAGFPSGTSLRPS